jgi:hypothetical protein
MNEPQTVLSLGEVARRLDRAGITILIKAMLGRGPEVGKHDWEDVEAMMAHLPTLDWEYLRWRAGTCIPQEHRQPMLQRLEKLWRQAGEA